MCAPVLHLGDARVRIVGIHPLLVRSLLFSLPIYPRKIFSRRRRDPGLLRQSLEKLFVALSVVPPHDRSQGRIRFQGRGVDPHPLPLHQSDAGQQFQHPGKHLAVRLQIDQPPCARDRRVVRRPLVQRYPYKLPNGQRVPRSPGDASLTVDAFEVTDQQQPEIDSRRQSRPPHGRRVESLTYPFHKSVKIVFRKKLIQPFIEGMARRPRQSATRNPKLLLVLPPRAHCHTLILRANILDGNCFLTFTPDC